MNLYTKNTFQSFWGISSDFAHSGDIPQEDVEHIFPGLPKPYPMNWVELVALSLGEEQFGPDHFQLKGLRHLYYQIRPFLPAWVRPLLHKFNNNHQKKNTLLQWPVEDRFVVFLFTTMQNTINEQLKNDLEYVHFWPNGKRFSFVITHDIETAAGQSFVRELADMDEKYGFRSSFNFVPKDYPIDTRLIFDLKQRGFEVGVHGWKHDGKLFSSRSKFENHAMQINQVLHEWGSVGFRSPMTHRNPEWMQALDIEYDSSFFDTDPYEPIPGGTMSIWPFQMGDFVELPYTLVQDHTLMITLGEKTPRIWLEKVEFIRKYCGMALVNVHPDYQRSPANFAIYEEFLRQMSQKDDYWQALPRDVARWWKARSSLANKTITDDIQVSMPGATKGIIRILKEENDIEFSFCQSAKR